MRYVTLLAAAGLMLAVAVSAQGITVTVETDPDVLANTVTNFGGAGLIVTSAVLSGHVDADLGTASSGTYTNPSGTYSATMGPGIILSTGSVADYADGPNIASGTTTAWWVPATSAQEALLDPITGGSYDHNDVTQLDITFNMKPGYDTVYFNVVFGSEEYPEFVGTTYIDGFGLYVNQSNIAFVDGDPVNIDHPDFAPIPGTELDGILNDRVLHTFSAFVGDESQDNTLTIIIADTSDMVLDSTVYISQLGGSPPPPPIPEPLTMLAVGMGVAGLAGYARKRRCA